jgi:glycosyltransferase XagB
MTIFEIILVIFSLLLAIQAGHTAWLMLYAWEDQGKLARNKAPGGFIQPELSFTILLPAREEEAVIQATIQRMVDLNYPRHLVQIMVILEASDRGTAQKVKEKLSELIHKGIRNVSLVTFNTPPINKPHGLNEALPYARGDVVVVFDAEDEPHADILKMINTVMVEENTLVVQSGVQLMNYADHWFSTLNVLEYFFWFKSRLHYHARLGMVPLGGNTIFIRRHLLSYIGGWDQNCLTEDADLGIRLSVRGVPIRIVYDDRYVTREETPTSISQFIKQRTRWTQGFLQVLRKNEWRRLPTFSQRLLAFYTLAFPLLQALLILYVPFSLYLILTVKVSELAAILSTLPLYMLVAHFLINLVGLYEFTSAHGLKPGPMMPIRMLAAYLPYQLLLNYSAFRALGRFLKGQNNWEKTAHVGAHLSPGGSGNMRPARAGAPTRTMKQR